MTNYDFIGKKILEGRKQMMLTQAELGSIMSISPQAIGKWERGESLPDVHQLIKLTQVFSVNMEYFTKEVAKNISPDENNNNPDTRLLRNQKKMNLDRDLSKGNWESFNFSHLVGIAQQISKSNFNNCTFDNLDLLGTSFQYSNIEECSFVGAELSNSIFTTCNFSNSNFTKGILNKSVWLKSNLELCNFSDVDFSLSNFELVNIEKCQFQNAILQHSKFLKSNLNQIIFTGKLEFCHFERVTFYNVLFKNATLINTFFKDNRRMKNIRFENCYCDQITYDLLKLNRANLTGLNVQ